MISEFSTHARPTNRVAKVIFLITVLISALLFVTSAMIELYRGIVGTVGLLFLVTAILFYTKYISVEFYYDVRCDSELPPTFIVRQIIGKRETTLCRIDLADVVKVEYEDKAARRAHKVESGVIVYNYIPTVFPKGICRITVKNRHEHAEITIEVTEELCKTLAAYASAARAMCSRDDDEY